MKWRRLAIILHRDLGYFFAGVVVIYGISGLAVNHRDDWDPSFIIQRRDVILELPSEQASVTETQILANLKSLGVAGDYLSFDFPSPKRIKVYLSDGSIMAQMSDGVGIYETIRRRPILHAVNRLHLNPSRWWLAFSDLFSASLIVIAVTGLFVIKGRKGLTGRGKWLVGAGLLVPLAALLVMP